MKEVDEEKMAAEAAPDISPTEMVARILLLLLPRLLSIHQIQVATAEATTSRTMMSEIGMEVIVAT